MNITCDSFGYFTSLAASTSLSLGPSDVSYFEISPEGTPCRILFFSYTSRLQYSGSPTNVWTGTTVDTLPRIEFKDSTSSNNLIFSSVGCYNPATANLGADTAFTQISFVNLPCGGLFCEDGVSLFLEVPSVGLVSTHSINVAYQK